MFVIEYIFRDNPTQPKTTFFLPQKEFCKTQEEPSTDVHPLKLGKNENLKGNQSLENHDEKPPTSINTECTSPCIKDTFDDIVSAPNNTLEEHTSTSVTQLQATDHQSDSIKQ